MYWSRSMYEMLGLPPRDCVLSFGDAIRLMHPDSDARTAGRVVLVTAGTSDRPVAEEALETLCWMRVETDLIVDVGVAGPQRLMEQLSRLEGAAAVVVVAGMEGALPSVVGGLVDCPVIAVPTSIGYGASFGGLAPHMKVTFVTFGLGYLALIGFPSRKRRRSSASAAASGFHGVSSPVSAS